MKKLLFPLTVISSLFLFSSCETLFQDEPDKDNSTPGKLTFEFQKPESITNVTYLAWYLTRPNFDTLSDTLDVSNGAPQTIEIGNIPSGIWTFKLDGLDSQYLRTYSGSVQITVYGGEVTAAEVTMIPVSGGISIKVNWGFNSGKAIFLDGDGDYVEFPQSGHLDSIATALTFEAWYNVTPKNYYNTIFSKGPSNFFFQAMGYSSYNPSFFLLNMDFNYQNAYDYYDRLVMTKTTQPNQWHHIAFTYEVQTGKVKVYYNGDLLYTTTASKTIEAGNGPLRIGARVYEEYPEYFSGMLDEVRIWSVIRTPEEIKANYKKELSGNETGLSAYYNFNSAANGVILDKSPHKLNGVIKGDIKLVTGTAF